MGKLKVRTKKPKVAEKSTAASHALATSKKPTVTDDDKGTTGNDLFISIKASPSWAAAIDVQSAANLWLATTTSLTANATTIQNLRGQLAAAIVVQRGLRVQWIAGRRHVIGAINVFCNGSSSLIEGFGFDVFTKAAADEITVPSDIVTSPGVNPGEVDVAWNGVDRHGFMVQWATDPTNAATYSVAIPNPTEEYTLPGQTSGATLHFRIAAIDPTQPGHITAWSAWVAGTAH